MIEDLTDRRRTYRIRTDHYIYCRRGTGRRLTDRRRTVTRRTDRRLTDRRRKIGEGEMEDRQKTDRYKMEHI